LQWFCNCFLGSGCRSCFATTVMFLKRTFAADSSAWDFATDLLGTCEVFCGVTLTSFSRVLRIVPLLLQTSLSYWTNNS
jgi:hypothetical protein